MATKQMNPGEIRRAAGQLVGKDFSTAPGAVMGAEVAEFLVSHGIAMKNSEAVEAFAASGYISGETWAKALKAAAVVSEEISLDALNAPASFPAPAGPTAAEIEAAKKAVEQAEAMVVVAAPAMKAMAEQMLTLAREEYTKLTGQKPTTARPLRPVIGANTKFATIQEASDFCVMVPRQFAQMLLDSGYLEYQEFDRKDENGKPMFRDDGSVMKTRRWMAYNIPVPGHGSTNIVFICGDRKVEHLVDNLSRNPKLGTWYPKEGDSDVPGLNFYDKDVEPDVAVYGFTLDNDGFATTGIARKGLTALGATNSATGKGKKGLSALGGS